MRNKKIVLSVIMTMILILCTSQVTYAHNDIIYNTTSQNTTSAAGNGDNTGNAAQNGETSDSPENDNTSGEGITDMGEGWPVPPEISAGSAILIDADTGTILYEKSSHIKAYPASVTKLMTALLVIENCSLSETVTFSYDAEHSVTWEDAKLDIVEGEQFTVEQAMYALLLKSANDVAYGLAEHVAGSVPAFAEMMNARAAQLGALNTHFANASGLNNPEHYTTAYDIAMFSRACMNNSTIIEMMNTLSYVIPPTNKYGYERTIYQRHEMLKKNSQYYYEYAVGGKTGFTDESKYTLCTFATKGDMNLIAVVLLCEEPEQRFIDTTALFEYGFNNFEKLTLDSADTSGLLNESSYYNSSVFGSSNVSFSLASSAVTVPIGVISDDIDMEISRDAASGDTFATVQFKYKDVVVGNSELLVTTTSNSNTSARPSNLPYLPSVETTPLVIKDYIVINAIHILYGVIIFLFLTIILLGLIFMNYSEYGKEVMKTRKRRRGYRRRKLRF
ncbi:MAG: D-alanyl-D-alanine carboxypeptidase [Thermoflexaceae bacterium]|nr:D-alanyl-D-alanine carboxypeptidase [Thermoflexaceae bacterium]